jgi:hypothetical protein
MYPKKIYAASVAVFLANTVAADDYTADGNVDMSVGSSSQAAVKIGKFSKFQTSPVSF